MKTKRNFFLGIILGSSVGWVLGFLRLPYLESNSSFWVGFAACALFILSGGILLYAWNKSNYILNSISKNLSLGSKNINRSYPMTGLLIFVFILSSMAIGNYLVFKQSESLKSQKKKFKYQLELIESSRNSKQVILMNNLFNTIDEELKNSPNRTLTDETIARIASLSHFLRPYRYLKGDSLSKKKLSPERGYLLLTLTGMGIDSNSFSKIMQTSTFSYADLEGTDLKGVNFQKANLREANLQEVNLRGSVLTEADLRKTNLKNANLKGAILAKADLREANLWGANLNNAVLIKANSKRANFEWAEIDKANLNNTRLDGAILKDAKLRSAKLNGTILRWANLTGVLMQEANLAGANLKGADLTGANLKNVNLDSVNLAWVNLKETNLTGADLTGVIIRKKDWIEKLISLRVIGEKEIRKKFKIVDDPNAHYKLRITKTEN